MDLYLYTFEDADGNAAHDTVYFEHGQAPEALEYGRRHGLAVIRNVYEWSDSELVEDFTGNSIRGR